MSYNKIRVWNVDYCDASYWQIIILIVMVFFIIRSVA